MRKMGSVYSWILVFAFITGAAFAGSSGKKDIDRKSGHKKAGSEHGMKGRIIERLVQDKELAQEIGLSEDQVNKLREGFYTLNVEAEKLRSELKLAGLKQAKLMTEEQINEEDLMKAVERAGEARTGLAKTKVKEMLLVKEHVSDEQLKKLRERMRERRTNMRQKSEQHRKKNKQ